MRERGLGKQRTADAKAKNEAARKASKNKSNTCTTKCGQCSRRCHKDTGHWLKHHCLKHGSY